MTSFTLEMEGEWLPLTRSENGSLVLRGSEMNTAPSPTAAAATTEFYGGFQARNETIPNLYAEVQ